MFVDSDYAEDKKSCRLISGFLMYVNTALVQWYSKKLSTVEASVLGAKFVAIEQGINAARCLRMIKISISSPSYIYGDNMSVVNNTSRPESVLKKKSNQVCYHTVCGSVAIGKDLVEHIPSNENIADLIPKSNMVRKRYI